MEHKENPTKEETAKKILEKDIVNYLIKHWDKLFDDIKFYKKEVEWLPGWRCDISAYTTTNLKDWGLTSESYNYRIPIFIEVKYGKVNNRDLLYELKRALTCAAKGKWPKYVGVIADIHTYSNPYIMDFIRENNIHTWQIDIKDDDINTLKITYIDNIQGDDTDKCDIKDTI